MDDIKRLATMVACIAFLLVLVYGIVAVSVDIAHVQVAIGAVHE